MKAITHDLSASGNDVKIVPLADLHIGDSQSDMKLIKNIQRKTLRVMKVGKNVRF